MTNDKYGVWHAEDFDGKDGGTRIQAAIDASEAAPGPNVVMVGPVGPDADSRWEVSKAIEVPSHTTLILQGAYLFLADRANCNLIENRDYIEGNEDIHVIGRGGARLDLNPSHQPQPTDHRDVSIWMEKRGMKLSDITKEVIGDMTVAEYTSQRAEVSFLIVAIRFYNVRNLSLRGFTIGPTVTFPLHIERVQNVRISDCTIAQDGREPWQEFIHVHGPAERVVIDNIVGSCSDDFCGMTTSESLSGPHHNMQVDKLPSRIRSANAGPIHGVVISNVVIRNSWCTGLLRLLPARGYPIDGVHVSNIQMLETHGRSEAHAVLKFGSTDSGNLASEYCIPEDMANITIENVFVKDWVGPYVVVLEPVKNLTIRGVRGNHTGPLLHNYGQAIDGLTLEDCRVDLTGEHDEPFVGPMMQFCMEEWGLDTTSRDGTPAAIILNKGPLKDVDIRNVVLTSQLEPDDMVTGSGVAGVRLGPDAQVQSLRISKLTIDGYETGVIVEDGVQGEDLRFQDITMRNVATPWKIKNANRLTTDMEISP